MKQINNIKKKYCRKCKLELPPNHKKQFCVSPWHACWCDDVLNKWRIENKIMTQAGLRKVFFRNVVGPLKIK